MKLLSDRLKWAMKKKSTKDGAEIIPADVARAANVKDASVNYWLNDINGISANKARLIADYLGVNALWLETGKEVKQEVSFTPDFKLINSKEATAATGEIEYWNVRGSCGGGFLNHEQIPKGHLIKEATFFAKYGLKEKNAFAIYADGDSMAEFIVDGDIVIFDKSKTQPISGQIFAIEHPDGLRIKVIRRSIDGSWTLESKNQDKRSFPDEVIPAGHTDLLKIHGQFVYRQGG
jgi:phage repressor protein C with HTH and peptisase S24 domain